MGRWLLVAVGGLIALSLRAGSSAPIPQQPVAKNAPGEAVGTPSCSARACHGRDEPLPTEPVGRHEYSAWNYSDPHTRSLQVLYKPESVKMTKALGLGEKPFEEPRCLACHAEKANEHGELRLGSVGCESCHGLSWKWLEPHTAKGWREKYPEAAASLLNVNDLVATAKSCVGCHIGAPPRDGIGVRDMNHDMIAAGHPRLNFEFAGYLAQLPPHWNPASRPHDASHFARAWVIGQAVSAKAALDLLEYRAGQPTWPELAEYACYACHHDLEYPKRWRHELKSKGTLPWGSWYFATLKSIAPDDVAKFDDFAAYLGARPDGKSVAQKAASLKPVIDAAIEKSRNNATPGAMRKSVAVSLSKPAKYDWDGAAQLYLAMAALSPDADRAKLAEFWRDLREPRRFSANREQYLQKLDALLDFAGAK